MFNGQGISRNTLLFFAMVFIVGIFIFGVLLGRKNDVPIAIEFANTEGPAVLVNSEKLYKQLESDGVFSTYREDLGTFARAAFPDYQQRFSNGINFTINNDTLQKNEETIQFSGVFDGADDTISTTITVLNFGQAKVSIVNEKTGQNINDKLSANSTKNQFIGSMPLKTKAYTIQYLEDTESFYVVLNGNLNKSLASARSALITGLGVEDLSLVDVSFVGFSSSGSITSIPNPDSFAD